MGVVIRKRAQAVEFFLASGIPQGELDVNIIDEDVVDVVFENGGLVYCRKIAAKAQSASDRFRRFLEDRTYPLVKTLRSEVLPQAPSPLFEMSISQLAVIIDGETVQ